MKDENEPDLLWHYTDAAGLLGIVSSGRLRFGDVRFLNDRTERVYGWRIVEEVLSSQLAAGDPHKLLQGIKVMLETEAAVARLFACALSETKESISQWQRYGADGWGYCLGISVQALDSLLSSAASRHRMLYDESEQRRHVEELLKKEHQRHIRSAKPGSEAQFIDVLFAGSSIEYAVLQMKNPFFRDEREWRYLVNLNPDDSRFKSYPEQFAIRGAYLKSFIELPVAAESPKPRLPIRQVICGPRLDSDLAEISVRHLLSTEGYDDISVGRSALAAIWR
jgi:Protein of unknown function (DUF2971)